MMSLPTKPAVATFFTKADPKNKSPLGSLVCNTLKIKFFGDTKGRTLRWRCSKRSNG